MDYCLIINQTLKDGPHNPVWQPPILSRLPLLTNIRKTTTNWTLPFNSDTLNESLYGIKIPNPIDFRILACCAQSYSWVGPPGRSCVLALIRNLGTGNLPIEYTVWQRSDQTPKYSVMGKPQLHLVLRVDTLYSS